MISTVAVARSASRAQKATLSAVRRAGDRALPPVEVGEVRAHAVAPGADRADEVAGHRLDLDHVGTLFGQHHGGQRPGHVGGEVDDPDALERSER